jgi:predicted nucleic acid-binding protein
LQVADLSSTELESAREYMRKFKDIPCDFADAILLTLAERLESKSIVSLDGHFNAYRVRGKALALSPGPRIS